MKAPSLQVEDGQGTKSGMLRRKSIVAFSCILIVSAVSKQSTNENQESLLWLNPVFALEAV
jgi:hypothetical protein